VPQLFATGFRPSDEAEGWIYGAYLARTRPDARIGVLYQNDLAGRELVAGLMRGFAPARSKVVVTSSYEASAADVQSQLAELKASGANVLALFATPRLARQAYAFASRLGWRPQLVVGSASAGTAVEGAISISSLKDPADPRWRDDAAVRLYRSIMARYARGANPRDLLHLQGMAAAYETVQLLKAAGKAPTRASVLAQSRRLRDGSNPFLLPGILVATSTVDRFPVEQAQLRRWSQGRWRSFGGLWSSKVVS
jgi:branched-chain amino acid transport system substrate-binding protein